MTARNNRKRKFEASTRKIQLLVFVLLTIFPLSGCIQRDPEPIRIGILHSLSGTMAGSESALVDAALLAVEEINESGGILGRTIDPVVADGKSEKLTFASEAERLIKEEGVSVIFGTWTSEHRKAVKSIVEKHDSLLFYPLQYEGLEQSPNIVYLGSTPNQQIIPAVEWCHRFIGPRMFLVGSDYIFPRVANSIISDELAEFGVDAVGEEYVPLGSTDFEPVIQKILQSEPDVILNTVNGDSNQAFFGALRKAGISSDVIPVMSFSIGEPEIQSLGSEELAGNFSAWSYFQSIDTSTNRDFLKAFHAHFGIERVIGDPMEAINLGVHLWASAVEISGSVDPGDVKSAMGGKAFSAARGAVRVDGNNQHLWQAARIGRVREDGQFDIVWESDILPPANFPASRSRSEWQQLLDSLYEAWGRNWASPGAP
jgi:urea transport system substrate-binding protein